MKVIRDIVLSLNYDEVKLYSTPYYSNFQFQSRFIGNYLRRQAKLSNFEPKGYKRLLINACLSECPPNTLSELYLCVYVPFEKEKYDNLKEDELKDFYIDLYLKGMTKAQETHQLPMAFLSETIRKFKANNYINEWEFKSKTIKEIGIKATLSCKMTIDFFSLTLILYKKNDVVFSKEILKTLPDEIIYHYQFKDISFKNNRIIVESWYDQPPLFELDLSFNA